MTEDKSNIVSTLKVALKSHTQALPDATLSEILVQAWNLYERNSTKRFEFPHTITLVSKTWRKVALINPTLWSDLVFDTSQTLDQTKINLRIQRTKSSPIDVSVWQNPDGSCTSNSGSSESTLEKIFQIILPHRMRFWSLCISLPARNAATPHYQLLGWGHNAGSPTQHAVSHVRELSIRGPGSYEPNDLAVYAPFLEKLDLGVRFPGLHFRSPTDAVGNGRLVKLHLGGRLPWDSVTLHGFSQTLEQNPRLHTIDISGSAFNGRVKSRPSTNIAVTLQHLHRLRLCLLSMPIISVILSTFEAPNLQDLVLEHLQGTPQAVDKSDYTSLHRKFNQLKRVSFYGMALCGLPLCPPSITHMTLKNCEEGELWYLAEQMHTKLPLIELPGAPSGLRPRFPHLHTLMTQNNPLLRLFRILQQPTSIEVVQLLVWDFELDNLEVLSTHLILVDWLNTNFRLEAWVPTGALETVGEKAGAYVEMLDENKIPRVDTSQVWTGQFER